ncbi:MAG TPA: hypothetical protein VFN75_05295 [Pseudonocardiaceae bacterium]|nr:hypothetical protein [Pseudonocardiaceae bacterium]
MLHDVVALVDRRIHPFELGVVCEVFGLDRTAEVEVSTGVKAPYAGRWDAAPPC